MPDTDIVADRGGAPIASLGPVPIDGAIGSMTPYPVVIEEPNLSRAWLRAFSQVTQPGVESLEPLVVSVTGFAQGEPEQTSAVTALIDEALAEQHRSHFQRQRPRKRRLPSALTCHGVANTIFPSSLWSPHEGRARLFARYQRIIPSLRRDPRNRRGTYFERLTAFGSGPCDGNQLEHIIDCYHRGIRRVSAFQATAFDPARDSTRLRLLGFPCLQQVAVHPDSVAGSLRITGFYATQYLFERAYGNYLGLCRLGGFLAHEMGLRLTRMTCMASYAPLYGITKERARRLAEDATTALARCS
jgi:hypothetical protein